MCAANGNPQAGTTDDIDIKDNSGAAVAKWCEKCKRWNKGNKLHYTRECNRVTPVPTSDNAQESNLADTTGSDSGNSQDAAASPAPVSDTGSVASPAGMLGLRGTNYDTPTARSANFWGVPRYGGRGY